MSCIERDVELDAEPATVWEELGELLDAEDRIRVVEHSEPPSHLSFFWAPIDGGDAPSHVDISLEPAGAGTILHIREVRLDGAELVRSAFHARARV
jgi:hypothetical protein